MDAIRSALFTLAFYLGSVPIVVVGALASAVHGPAIVGTARLWADWFWWCVHNILRIRVVIRGTPPQHAVIVASKHQSAFETIAVLHLFDHPAVVLKAELVRIPFWGFIARRHGVIPVDRENSGTAMRTMMRAAQSAVAANRPIVIFPEGSRMPVGEAPPLKAGVSGLYRLLKLPVIPVALDSGRLWPRRSFVKRRGTITIAFGEQIPPGLPRDEIEARLHEAINRDPATQPIPSS